MCYYFNCVSDKIHSGNVNQSNYLITNLINQLLIHLMHVQGNYLKRYATYEVTGNNNHYIYYTIYSSLYCHM